MNFSTLVEQLIAQTTQHSLWCFAPEIVISLTIVALLLVRLVNLDRSVPNYMFALFGAFAAFGLALWQGYDFANSDRQLTVDISSATEITNASLQNPNHGAIDLLADTDGNPGKVLVFTPAEDFRGHSPDQLHS